MSDFNDREMGIWLRNRRIRLRLTLDDISTRTNIWPYHLEAIEEGNFDDLPGGLYNRAYLRQYAAALGVKLEAARPPTPPEIIARISTHTVLTVEANVIPRPRQRKVLTGTTEVFFALAEALLPPRICREELGDAREYIADGRRPIMLRWVKLVSALFWVSLNAVREYVAALGGKKAT